MKFYLILWTVAFIGTSTKIDTYKSKEDAWNEWCHPMWTSDSPVQAFEVDIYDLEIKQIELPECGKFEE